MDRGAWWAAVHGVAKSRTRLSNFTFTFHFSALEKEMATHSSVLAWRIPGTGAHRVGHDWRDLAGAALFSMTKYIHIVVQLSLCIHLLNFLPSLVETLSPLSINSSFPPTRSLASNNVLTESMNLTILGISYKWSQTVFVCTYCILEGRM